MGTYETSSRKGDPLAEVWNGKAWAVQLAPTSFASAILNGVSCASAASCTAVGVSDTNTGGATVGIAEVWDGTSWSNPSTPNSPTSNNYLVSVSCPQPGTCIAAGYSRPGQQVGEPGLIDRTLIESGD